LSRSFAWQPSKHEIGFSRCLKSTEASFRMCWRCITSQDVNIQRLCSFPACKTSPLRRQRDSVSLHMTAFPDTCFEYFISAQTYLLDDIEHVAESSLVVCSVVKLDWGPAAAHAVIKWCHYQQSFCVCMATSVVVSVCLLMFCFTLLWQL
jgi:hypothetical protein